MNRKKEKGTEKMRREPPVFEFGGEVTVVRLALTRVSQFPNRSRMSHKIMKQKLNRHFKQDW